MAVASAALLAAVGDTLTLAVNQTIRRPCKLITNQPCHRPIAGAGRDCGAPAPKVKIKGKIWQRQEADDETGALERKEWTKRVKFEQLRTKTGEAFVVFHKPVQNVFKWQFFVYTVSLA
jgi:hypothetical protein